MDKSIRGNRSNLTITECYDTETGQWVWVELDLREPFGRYIPIGVMNKAYTQELDDSYYKDAYKSKESK